jgi:hypothetical protein
MKSFPIACLLILIFFGGCRIGIAQINIYHFEHLFEQQRLSRLSIMNILQNGEGFMRFETAYGINEYYGYIFTALKPDPDGTERLDSTLVKLLSCTSLFMEQKGILFVGIAGEALNYMDTYSKLLNFTRS